MNFVTTVAFEPTNRKSRFTSVTVYMYMYIIATYDIRHNKMNAKWKVETRYSSDKVFKHNKDDS